jgi:hypothetical protein
MTNVWLPFLRSCEKFSVEEQFRLREDKTRITRGGQRQIVNRIVVNESAPFLGSMFGFSARQFIASVVGEQCHAYPV